MGLGWTSTFASGKGSDTITSGFEGAWTANPTQWDNGYFDLLFGYEWEQVTTPAGAIVWHAIDPKEEDLAPDAQDASVKVPTMMTTADMALREDPIYNKISKRFHENPDEFSDAFARAWFKLTHRDMGPISLYLGSDVPKEELVWQDPIPEATAESIDASDISELKKRVLASGLSTSELVATAWGSASSFRGSDKRGGANGARIRLEPQRSWEVNNPTQLNNVLTTLAAIQKEFNEAQISNKTVSMADLIVLAGSAAIEDAASKAGHTITVPFTAGRTDASQEQTDVESFAALEPKADGFRNYLKPNQVASAEELLLDKAHLLNLTAPEMTVLVGGMRALSANYNNSQHGIFTINEGTLTNDYFKNLLDLRTTWKAITEDENVFEGTDRATGSSKWTGTRVDLIFGSNSELRVLSEVYACEDGNVKFVNDFVAAWTKVMNLDRFDLK
jgi:catalase-peroxidase